MFRFLTNLLLKPGPRYSWPKVILILFVSMFFVSGSFMALTWVKTGLTKSKSISSPIRLLAQNGKPFFLPTQFLAEILDISQDVPPLLLEFKTGEAKKKMLRTHLVKKVHFKKIKPDILYVDYTLRNPIAFLEDFSNTAFDEEGVLFAFTPFFSAKNLPKIYLGEENPFKSWGENLEKKHVGLILDFFKHLDPKQIQYIDLSHMSSENYGKRQIILSLRSRRTLRLTQNNYRQELAKYFLLEETVLKNRIGGYIIDLRTDDIAYLQPM